MIKPTAIHRGFELWRSGLRWQRAIEEALRPLGLTSTQFLVLFSTEAALQKADDAIRQNTIALEAGLDEATTSRIVRTLEGRGLLDRGPTGGDERAWRVILSTKGERLLQKATLLVEQRSKRFLAQCG